MVIRARPPRPGGYSLDEAARLSRDSGPHHTHVPCPGCGTACETVVGADPTKEVWILRCPVCRRGVVLHKPTR